MISLKQLKYFDAVVRFGHFGRAADHCAVTQPALSMQIQNLETMLGGSLLERSSGGIIPTRLGRAIAERSANILKEVRDLEDFANHSFGVLEGQLNLGVIPSIAPYLLPPLLPELKSTFPQLNLSIRESQTDTLLSELLRGELDLLIIALPVENISPDVAIKPLFEDRFVLALPRNMQTSGKMLAPLDLLNSEALLLLEEGHCMRDQAIAYCHLQQAGRLNTRGASSLSTLVQMVANGLGITLLPEMSIEVESRHSGITFQDFEAPQPSRQIGLAWRKSSPRIDDFLAFGEVTISAKKTPSA